MTGQRFQNSTAVASLLVTFRSLLLGTVILLVLGFPGNLVAMMPVLLLAVLKESIVFVVLVVGDVFLATILMILVLFDSKSKPKAALREITLSVTVLSYCN